MNAYIENPKDSTRKLLELINEYSKVAGYKIHTQKSLAFLYTNNEKTEREIKERIPFTIAMKIIEYLGIRSDQIRSVTQSRPTLCDPMNRSTPGLPVHHQLSEFTEMSIESVMPSSHLILWRPLLLPPIPPSIRVFSNESTLLMRWPKYWSFSFSKNGHSIFDWFLSGHDKSWECSWINFRYQGS